MAYQDRTPTTGARLTTLAAGQEAQQAPSGDFLAELGLAALRQAYDLGSDASRTVSGTKTPPTMEQTRQMAQMRQPQGPLPSPAGGQGQPFGKMGRMGRQIGRIGGQMGQMGQQMGRGPSPFAMNALNRRNQRGGGAQGMQRIQRLQQQFQNPQVQRPQTQRPQMAYNQQAGFQPFNPMSPYGSMI